MCTYSTCFDHSGGSLKVMNIQLVKIVHIMIMLKRVSSWLRKNLDIRGNHKIQLNSVKIKAYRWQKPAVFPRHEQSSQRFNM